MRNDADQATEPAQFVGELFSIANKNAVVTGGTHGIGAFLVKGLLRAGANVITCARGQAALDALMQEMQSDRCAGFATDLSTEDGIEAFVRQVEGAYGDLHILINNVGISWGAPLAEHGRDTFAKVLNLNLTTTFEVSRRLFPLLRRSSRPDDPARVINIGSMQAFTNPSAHNYGYAASKAAIPMLTKHLARDGAPDILVNCISPGLFPSRMSAHLFDKDHPAYGSFPIPLGRPGALEDITGAAIYLSSRASRWVTGVDLLVAGGMASID